MEKIKNNVCQRMIKTLPTFAMNPTIFAHNESYVGSQILTYLNVNQYNENFF